MLETRKTPQLPAGVRLLDSHPLGKDFLVQRFALDNGLQVLIMEDPSAPLFAYHTWFRVGSRYEKPGTTGIAHLFEHMMFKATSNYPDAHYTTTLETYGGQINAGTSKDWTYYYINIPSSRLDTVASLEADRMQNVILSDAQINTEREVVKEERRMRTDDNIDGQMEEQLTLNAFKVHPYSWPIIGHMKDLDNISREDCEKFYKTYYAPNNATLVVVGDVKTEAALRTIVKHYGGIPASEVPKLTPPAEPPQQAERRHIIRNKSLLEEKMVIAYHIPAGNHPDRAALEVLNTLLIDGKSSRLYRKLVDETKLATAVSGHVDFSLDPSLFRIYISMAGGNRAEEAEKIIYAELTRMAKEAVGDRELEKTKNSNEANMVRILKTNQYKAFMLGYFQTVLGDYREFFKELGRYRDVKADDVLRVAAQYFSPRNRTVIHARPNT